MPKSLRVKKMAVLYRKHAENPIGTAEWPGMPGPYKAICPFLRPATVDGGATLA
jgi:hypothetical protein